MKHQALNRRTLLKAATGLAVSGMAAGVGCAQTGTANRNTQGMALPQRGEFVIRGAHVLTLDTAIGDFARGDVHLRDGAILAVNSAINAPSATVIDANGMICLPGFVETHWHLWTSMLRPLMSTDDAKRGYFPVSNAMGRFYTPRDHYASVRLGLAEALSAGATTVHNWAHNIATPDHADAELRAMRDTGLRGRFSYGAAQGLPNDQPLDLAGLAKIKQQWMPNDGLLTLGICSRNVGDGTNPLRGNISIDMARKEWGGARTGAADHHAHLGAQPGDAAGKSRPAGTGCATGASAADHRRRTQNTPRARRELQHLAGGRIAASGERRRDSVGGAAGGGRQGQPID
jgi:hypothetical protein